MKLTIYNAAGEKVAELINAEMKKGEHEITWDAGEFPAGVYFGRISVGNQNRTLRMILLK